MPRIFRLGTRTSDLALWQAAQVQVSLERLGYSVERVELQSKGDLITDVPLDSFGKPGVFTDRFDEGLYNNEIDFAVHSLKDYPATTPDGLFVGAHLERGNPVDTLALRKPLQYLDPSFPYVIATCSSRRLAQWKQRFPHSQMEPIRGNVPTRLEKVARSGWHGAIFARAGLDRLGLHPAHTVDLDWMIPAPAQAVVAAVCRADDHETKHALSQINHADTAFTSELERAFMAHLGGGCEAPIGGIATLHEDKVHFKGCYFIRDDGRQIVINTIVDRQAPHLLAERFASLVIKQAEQLSSITEIRES